MLSTAVSEAGETWRDRLTQTRLLSDAAVQRVAPVLIAKQRSGEV
jgi:hypothetical protein